MYALQVSEPGSTFMLDINAKAFVQGCWGTSHLIAIT